MLAVLLARMARNATPSCAVQPVWVPLSEEPKTGREEEEGRKEGRRGGCARAGGVGRVESGGKHSCLHMNAFPPKFFWAIFGVRIEKSCCGGDGMRSRIMIVMVIITTSRSLSCILSVSVCVCLCLLFGLCLCLCLFVRTRLHEGG